MKNGYVDIDNSRWDDQRKVMEEIAANQECPFCPESLQKYHTEESILEGKFWIITKNRWPYQHTKVHLLAIYKKHAVTLSELDPNAGAELFTMFADLEKSQNYPGGGLAMRFGDTDYSAGTINHIHVQFMIPDIERPDFQPVRFKIGKDREKIKSA